MGRYMSLDEARLALGELLRDEEARPVGAPKFRRERTKEADNRPTKGAIPELDIAYHRLVTYGGDLHKSPDFPSYMAALRAAARRKSLRYGFPKLSYAAFLANMRVQWQYIATNYMHRPPHSIDAVPTELIQMWYFQEVLNVRRLPRGMGSY